MRCKGAMDCSSPRMNPIGGLVAFVSRLAVFLAMDCSRVLRWPAAQCPKKKQAQKGRSAPNDHRGQVGTFRPSTGAKSERSDPAPVPSRNVPTQHRCQVGTFRPSTGAKSDPDSDPKAEVCPGPRGRSPLEITVTIARGSNTHVQKNNVLYFCATSPV